MDQIIILNRVKNLQINVHLMKKIQKILNEKKLFQNLKKIKKQFKQQMKMIIQLKIPKYYRPIQLKI